MSTPNKATVTYMPPALQQWLEQEAKRTFTSVGAVIRRAVQKLKEESK